MQCQPPALASPISGTNCNHNPPCFLVSLGVGTTDLAKSKIENVTFLIAKKLWINMQSILFNGRFTFDLNLTVLTLNGVFLCPIVKEKCSL